MLLTHSDDNLCFRMLVSIERDSERNITRGDTMIVTSKKFFVDWSSDYSLSLHKNSLDSCPIGKKIFYNISIFSICAEAYNC